MADFHGLRYAMRHDRSSHAGSESEEEHPATFIAPQGLHRSVIDYPHWASECLLEVETDPATAQVRRVADRPSAKHETRITDGQCFVAPVGGSFLDFANHLLRRHLWTGRDFQTVLVTR